MARFYSLDLADLHDGSLRPSRAARLAAHLPRGAQVYVSEGSDRQWTDAEHLLRIVSFQLAQMTWQNGGGKGKKPEPLPTPSQARKEAPVARTGNAAMKRQLERARANRTPTHS